MQPQVRLAPVSPWGQGAPAIHGPDIYGASANRSFLYAIPTTGERPIQFGAEGLPEGLRLDPAAGHITGAARREGDWPVLLRAGNRHGKAEKELVLAIGRGLALTPPMGWNSWNAWRRWVDDAKVRAAADGLVKRGLAARGYSYVNIDSCWQGARGGPYNAIQPNSKFPAMRLLADYVHAQGLKLGIYSTPWAVPWGCSEQEAVADWGGPGLVGCSSGAPDPDYPIHPIPTGHYVGLEKHEAQDVAQWVEWGVDFVKYDWAPTDPRSLERMGRALRAAARDIVLSICTEARLTHIEAYKTWAQMWRGIPDTFDNWSSLLKNAFMSDDYLQEDWRPHIGPGAWHDLDMFALGPQFSTQAGSCPNKLTPDEQITHMTAWALYPSPLILSCDLAALSEFELRLFGNEEVIAVNQDRLGKPAIRLGEGRSQLLGVGEPTHHWRIWARPLADASYAVGLFNLADTADEASFDLKLLGLSGSAAVRNLWERCDLGRMQGRLSIAVPAHGAQLVRVKP
jgi:alpha-galactosidase